MIGEVVGNYRVLAKIGAGGMGTVWLGEHLLLGSRAAIKVLQPGMSTQEKIVQRFFDEAKASSRIRDPGIVTVLDFGKHNGDAYIVMELLQGNTLTQRLGHDKMPPLEALRLVQMSALAMAAAHARGIIHRDLKPDNIFVVADPAVPGGERVKILDFGIAKLIDRDPDDSDYMPTVAGTIMGTPAFMSPEQCRAAGEVDHRADIYALGCVLFNLLCGRPPFIAQTQGDMIVAQIQDEPPRPSHFVKGLASEIDVLVLRCLAKKPDDRYQNMTDIVRAASAITGDNTAIGTIPPMLAQDSGSISGPETMPSTPPTATREPKSPSEGGEMAAVTQITSPPSEVANTTLAGGATSVDTSSSIPVHRPRYGVVALLLATLVGGIAIAALVGGHRERAATPPPADAAIDAAAAKPMAVVIDAQPAVAPVDANELIPLKTMPDGGVSSRPAHTGAVPSHDARPIARPASPAHGSADTTHPPI